MTTISATIRHATNSTGPATETMLGINFAVDGLPVLAGTDKQIAWAQDIRDAAILDACQQFAGRMASLRGNFVTAQARADLATVQAALDKLATAIDGLTNAKDWIEAAGGAKSFLTLRALLGRRPA